VRAANSRICAVAGASSLTNSMRFTHLMHVQPYQPGTISRTGAPWSAGSGAPFIRVASSARSRSDRAKIQLAPGTDVRAALASWSTPDTSRRWTGDAGRTRSSTRANGTPSQSAVLSRP
jgi:hypothetical protein